MQHLEFSGAVWPLKLSLGVKWLARLSSSDVVPEEGNDHSCFKTSKEFFDPAANISFSNVHVSLK